MLKTPQISNGTLVQRLYLSQALLPAPTWQVLESSSLSMRSITCLTSSADFFFSVMLFSVMLFSIMLFSIMLYVWNPTHAPAFLCHQPVLEEYTSSPFRRFTISLNTALLRSGWRGGSFTAQSLGHSFRKLRHLETYRPSALIYS